jgi:hypothetical protein
MILFTGKLRLLVSKIRVTSYDLSHIKYIISLRQLFLMDKPHTPKCAFYRGGFNEDVGGGNICTDAHTQEENLPPDMPYFAFMTYISPRANANPPACIFTLHKPPINISLSTVECSKMISFYPKLTPFDLIRLIVTLRMDPQQ